MQTDDANNDAPPWTLDPRVVQLQEECKLRLRQLISIAGVLLTMSSLCVFAAVWGSLSVRGIFDIGGLATGVLFAYSTIVFYTSLHKSIAVTSRTITFRCGFVVLAIIGVGLFSALQTYTIAASCTQTPIPSVDEDICTNGYGLLLASVIGGWAFFVILIAAAVLEYRLSDKVAQLAKYVLDMYNYLEDIVKDDPNVLAVGRWDDPDFGKPTQGRKMAAVPPQEEEGPVTTAAAATAIPVVDFADIIEIGKRQRKGGNGKSHL